MNAGLVAVTCPYCGIENALVLPPTRVEMFCKGRRCGVRFVRVLNVVISH